MSEMTPREIVSELNKHIIGQDNAKRSVAIALRNRWRRMQLDEELRHEVTVHFFTYIAHFGELSGFNFDERRVSQFRQTASNFGFTNTGWADHQNVFWRHFMAQLFVELHAAPAVTR